MNHFLGVKLDSNGFLAMYANQHETLQIGTVLLGKLYQHSVMTYCKFGRANYRCFPPGRSHQRVNLCACSLSQMVMQEDTEIYPGSGKRRPYVQRGRGLYYLAPKCLYRGEYKRGMKCVSPTAYVCSIAWCSIPESLLLLFQGVT